MNITLNIELIGTQNPKVWRQISIPISLSFHELHVIIQKAFGWRDSHLYLFSENGFHSLLSICSPHDSEAALKASEISAAAILMKMHNSYMYNPEQARKLKYIYDYGDSWEHEITSIEFDRDNDGGADVLAGGGACPPENCSGIHGFEDLKSCLKTGKPSALTGENWKLWLDECGYENYDPEVFDLEESRHRVQNRLRKI